MKTVRRERRYTAESRQVSATHLEENSIPPTRFPTRRRGAICLKCICGNRETVRSRRARQKRQGDGLEGKGEAAAEASLILGEHQERAVGEYVGAEALGEEIVHIEHDVEAARSLSLIHI